MERHISTSRDNLQMVQVHSTAAINVSTPKCSLWARILLSDWALEETSNALQMHPAPFPFSPTLPQRTFPYFCSPSPSNKLQGFGSLPLSLLFTFPSLNLNINLSSFTDWVLFIDAEWVQAPDKRQQQKCLRSNIYNCENLRFTLGFWRAACN